ncbi:acetoin utilization protein AcuC [Arthrobacter sp. Hiyo4]|nr:acetoin utilization protein AcuC [Arthrobacter sp. Hiyo4]
MHSPEFVAAVRRVSDDPTSPDEARGLGTDDDPAFAGMHDAAARLAGGSLAAASAILDGSALHAVNFGGACTTPPVTAPAASAFTTTPHWPSRDCSTAASAAWRTSTSMRTMGTGRKASSGTTPGS